MFRKCSTLFNFGKIMRGVGLGMEYSSKIQGSVSFKTGGCFVVV